jgi:PadR family transcriptional regulator, regulatory protein AphA
MQEIRLTPASYIVLGLLSWTGEATPYRLKQLVAGSVGFFWSLQHAQLYTEPERLARAGYVRERREEGGRRRKQYALTDQGREALAEWRGEPTAQLSEVRDLGLLKLFFGADAAALADVQLDAHRAELAEYEGIRAGLPEDVPEGPRLALELGMRQARTWIEFWEELADRQPG